MNSTPVGREGVSHENEETPHDKRRAARVFASPLGLDRGLSDFCDARKL